MDSDIKAWATLAAAAFYAALLGVKLWPLCRRPLLRGVAFCRRQTIEAIVAAVFTGIAVHCGATKSTNGNDRAGSLWDVSRRGAEVQREDVHLRDGASETNLWFTCIERQTNSVLIGAAWNADAFSTPPFLEFYVSTNLSDDESWVIPGWAEALPGETNMVVEIEASRLPGGEMPSALFVKMEGEDGIASDLGDYDEDGVADDIERAIGTNPRRADTDGDGFPDGVEAARISYGASLPSFDLSSLSNVVAGTLTYQMVPASVMVDIPFWVEIANNRSNRAVVHYEGIVAFLGEGVSGLPAYNSFGTAAGLYSTSQAAVAAYGCLFMNTGGVGSQLRAGTVYGTQGRWFVAEWRNMVHPSDYWGLTLESSTFLLAVAESDPGRVFVRYSALGGSVDGSTGIVGAHGFGGNPDLLVANCVYGSVTNGMTIVYDFGCGTDPLNPDTDGDGLLDGWEAVHGMDPLVDNATDGDPRTDADADPDHDGLSNIQESALGTDPFQPDTDGDGMDDGWEAQYGFDPLVENGQTARTDDDADADPDGDGLTNAEECAWGTNPLATVGYDTDGDGVNDGAEIAQNSDPADPSDGGKPNSRVPISFYFGDHSSSHSEKYRLMIIPVVNRGSNETPRTYSWLNAVYGQCESRTANLAPGWMYELHLDHSATNHEPGPDYDYTLNAINLPSTVSLSDPDELLGVHASSNVFTGEGKAAVLTVYKIEPFVCSPDGDDWQELDVSRVVLDGEQLRIKVAISPQVESLSAFRQKFGDSVLVKTSGTCPLGTAVSMDGASFVNSDGKSEIRVSRSFAQLKALGLLPQNDEDGVDEMAWYDIGDDNTTSLSNLSDSRAFAMIGYQFRGQILQHSLGNLSSTPPVSVNSESFYKAAGSEIVSVKFAGVDSEARQIMNQADYFYYSGHGRHSDGSLMGLSGGPRISPTLVAAHWDRDLKCVVFAGCSVLDINDYNNKYLGTSEHASSPGKLWAALSGPESFLGYAYKAPRDTQGADTIASGWVANRSAGCGDVDAWMKANDNRNGRNACAIDSARDFHYFKKLLWKTYKRTVVPKASQ